MDPISAPKIQKLELGVRKPQRNDIKWSNPWGDQATHFVGCTERPNADNYSYNRKKVGTTSDGGPIICVSFAKKRKTQVGWATIIGQKAQKWTKVNNIPPNGSPYRIHDFDEMTMKSPCWIAWEKYNGDGCAYNHWTNGKNWSKKLIEYHNSWKMVDHDNELKVLQTSTYNTTQSRCKSNIVRTS